MSVLSGSQEAAIRFAKDNAAWLLRGTADDLEGLVVNAVEALPEGTLSDEWHRGVAFSVLYIRQMADRIDPPDNAKGVSDEL